MEAYTEEGGVMREIKFRIRIGDSWFYWGFIDEGHGLMFKGLPSQNIEPLSMEDLQERSQQYIGYKDKNGKEVYRGDMVQIHGVIARPPIGEVKYIRGAWFLGGADGWRLGNFNQDDCEVIGNIDENPELLK
jgi:hypothetical protein